MKRYFNGPNEGTEDKGILTQPRDMRWIFSFLTIGHDGLLRRLDGFVKESKEIISSKERFDLSTPGQVVGGRKFRHVGHINRTKGCCDSPELMMSAVVAEDETEVVIGTV